MQVWLKTKWHREPNKRMRHLVTPPVNTTCGPFFGRGEMVHEDLKWHFILAELLTCAILYTKACIVALNLNLTCWHASGVKRGRKKEEILRGYFIHSMCPPSVFPRLFTDDKQKSDQYQIRPLRLISSCFHMVQWLHTAHVYLMVNCLRSNCFQRAATTSTLHPREPSDSSMPIQRQKCSAARSLAPIVYLSGGG